MSLCHLWRYFDLHVIFSMVIIYYSVYYWLAKRHFSILGVYLYGFLWFWRYWHPPAAEKAGQCILYKVRIRHQKLTTLHRRGWTNLYSLYTQLWICASRIASIRNVQNDGVYVWIETLVHGRVKIIVALINRSESIMTYWKWIPTRMLETGKQLKIALYESEDGFRFRYCHWSAAIWVGNICSVSSGVSRIPKRGVLQVRPDTKSGGGGGGGGSHQAQYEKWGFYAKRHAVFTLSLTNGCNFGRGGAQAPGALSLGMRLRKP